MTEWDQRQLCADGSCVGVIGSDGTCRVCGRAAPNWGDERMRGMVAENIAEPPLDEGPIAAPTKVEPEWEGRKLCSDGGCVGLIGDDGKCKVCGRSAA